MEDKIKKMAELNDLCRRQMGVVGQIWLSEGIASLPLEEQAVIRAKVERYHDFSQDNDPDGERNAGAFEHGAMLVFWMIDYYDKSLNAHSPDPSDPALTTRVLKISFELEG